MDRHMALKIPCPGIWWQPHGCTHTRVYNPAGSLQYVSQSLPITLLVLCEVPGEHGAGPVFLRHKKRGFTECLVLLQAAFRWGDFLRIAELFSVTWISSVAMRAFSQIKSASISLISWSCIENTSFCGQYKPIAQEGKRQS
jgi:hypothetical protein